MKIKNTTLLKVIGGIVIGFLLSIFIPSCVSSCKRLSESNRIEAKKNREKTQKVIDEIKSKGLKHYIKPLWEGTEKEK